VALFGRNRTEHQLAEVGQRLRALRDELRVIDEQLRHLADEAEDARIRALVSETPLADREYRDNQRHADAMGRRRSEVVARITTLEARQDELLDRLPRA
jgi:chromosome segregation ATPase